MKTLITGLLVVGFASLGFSQSSGIEQVELSEISVIPFNTTYLNQVQDENTPERVKEIENVASQFDIMESKTYNEKYDAYEVIFKETNGRIIATYDKHGKIISSSERFHDVLLPYKVRRAVFKQYPDWTLQKNSYLVSYYLNKDVKKVYRVLLKKDGERKNLKVDTSGNII